MAHAPLTEILVASHNAGKIAEIRDLFGPLGVAVTSAAELNLPEPEETGDTFEANAATKALAAATASGKIALSDDSGLIVDALDGAPGVYTADWATLPDGSRDFAVAMQKVEDALQARGALTEAKRTGRFVSMLCLATPDGDVSFYRGEADGVMVWPPRGTSGFGYDPVFRPDGHTRTFGEMTAEEKHGWKPGQATATSHRARAFKLFAEQRLGVPVT
ncbi:Xanthosine triphosphate pyrophosphatase [Hoeflea phototrophica DFL-43]|jgi:XTP/dITP diphosphohydrolase|uniref:dITP/XTP pyrophosphatase n=1 Tax=Hoeflea phototrophica (strain DSM 17068 / NCIMB 14078 / DFL-43) TaxID=411684 RepID=A9CX10_HOEPD|nr:non-canonical purine NTP pyrophosphatase [Hoeflea phototrophica]EDQ35599.1 Xanthosine triphosphate pyrophosphatase [Hoeflea phototrophica DFL-43]